MVDQVNWRPPFTGNVVENVDCPDCPIGLASRFSRDGTRGSEGAAVHVSTVCGAETAGSRSVCG